MRHLGIAFPAQATAAKLRHRARVFWLARQAIAAAEFALVLPLFVTLMLGAVEVARLITFARKVTLVAMTAVEMLSQNGTGTVNYITCGVQLTPVPDKSVPSKTTLPTDVFGPGSLIVVDIVFNYTPIFGLGLFGTIPIARPAYLAPRYVPLIKYVVASGDDGIGAECPGN